MAQRIAQPALGRRNRLYHAMERLLIVYLAAILAVMWIRGVRVTPDLFFVFVGLGALLMGRGIAFVRDWFPLVAILLAWQAMRGIAFQAGFAVQSDTLIAIERFLHFGVVPSEALQATLRGTSLTWIDVATTFVYQSHFVVPLAVGFALWMHARPAFQRYMVVLLLVSLAQFLTTIFVPAAPPRFAHMFGESLAVVDVADVVQRSFGWNHVSWAYANMNPNPVAALPSLHAAYPLIAFLAVRQVWPRASWGLLAYVGVVWFAIVYLAHHYLIDAYAAAIYVAVVWRGVSRWWPANRGQESVVSNGRDPTP